VYRTPAQVLGSVMRILDAVAAPCAAEIAGTLPLSTTHGITTLLAAAARRGTLGLVERFEPAAVLTLFASREFHYWPAVPVMAEMLTRLAERRPSGRWRVPAMCTVAGAPLTVAAWRAFRKRFGVPLRAIYGSTEVGVVSIDAAPSDEVRPGRAGQAPPGVEVLIGDDPRAPGSPGGAGRIWVRSPLYMEGYGYPPELEQPPAIDGWRALADRGWLDDGGNLYIAGRADDAFKTQGGYLVEPAAVAAALNACDGVTDAIVVPVETPSGIVAGALVESPVGVRAPELRAHLETALPSWSRPRMVHVVGALPRLATGKIDRMRCSAILHDLAAPARP
jgi:long-chain acyl-CoA synthetase